MARMQLSKCNHCQTVAWHQRSQQSPIGFDCANCGKLIVSVNRPTTTNAAWGARGGQSMRFAFNPKTPEKWKQDMPSAEVNQRTGELIYKSDSHQKAVYREMGIAKEKYEAQAATAAEKHRREQGDHQPECPFDFGSPVPITGPSMPVTGKPVRLKRPRKRTGALTNG